MNKDIGKAVKLGTQNLEIGTKIAETTETILGKIKMAFDSSQQEVAATFVDCGLLDKMEVEETKAVQKAAEATPKKKEAPAEKKPASPLQQRRGARRGAPPAAAAVVAPSPASRVAPRAVARKTRAGGGAPVAVASRAPAAVASRAPAAAAVNIMSKASPSTAAQTFGLLMSTLLSLKHDEWSKKVDALHHGVRYGPCLATPFTAPRPHHPHCPHYPHCPHCQYRPSDQPASYRLRRSSSTSSAPTRWTRWTRPSCGCSRACSR